MKIKDLVETKNLISKYEEEIIDNYKKLLEIYGRYKQSEEIEDIISNFVTIVKQVLNKFDIINQ